MISTASFHSLLFIFGLLFIFRRPTCKLDSSIVLNINEVEINFIREPDLLAGPHIFDQTNAKNYEYEMAEFNGASIIDTRRLSRWNLN